MKEVRYFYAPDISFSPVLPDEEAAHAVRVLRLQEGDELLVTDGRGGLFRCHVALASAKHCSVTVDEVLPASKGWPGQVCLAVAPTKNIDRLEWLAEKATEIGFDTLSLLLCDFSERRVVKAERLEKILVAAMKQSHKAWLPRLEAPERFSDFIRRPFDGQKFIAHCYAPSDVGGEEVGKPFLLDALRHGGNALRLPQIQYSSYSPAGCNARGGFAYSNRSMRRVLSVKVSRLEAIITPRKPAMPYRGSSSAMAAMRKTESATA